MKLEGVNASHEIRQEGAIIPAPKDQVIELVGDRLAETMTEIARSESN